MKKIVMAILVLALFLGTFQNVSLAAGMNFTDVSKKHWAYGDIESMYNLGLVKGVTSNQFGPEKNISRAEFVTILTRILGLEGTDSGYSKGHWASRPINVAEQFGVIDKTDYPNGFGADVSITRREMAKMIALSFTQKNEYKELLATFKNLYYMDFPFVDAKEMKQGDIPYIALAYGTGIIGGDNNAKFNLNDKATRAQATAMLHRLVNNKDKVPSEYRALQELSEVAKTGSNMTTVSKFIPKQTNFNGLIQENANFKAELKRIYVMPLEGQSSIYEQKFIWDRANMPAFYQDRNNVKGVVASVVNVTFKSNANFFVDFIQKMVVSPSGMFNYQVPKDKFGLLDFWQLEEAKKGKTYEIIVWGNYGISQTRGDFYIIGNNSPHYLFFKKQGEY